MHSQISAYFDNTLCKYQFGFKQGYTFFYIYKQSIFDPRPENCLSFSEELPPKIV